MIRKFPGHIRIQKRLSDPNSLKRNSLPENTTIQQKEFLHLKRLYHEQVKGNEPPARGNARTRRAR